jgi:hypothetical protein
LVVFNFILNIQLVISGGVELLVYPVGVIVGSGVSLQRGREVHGSHFSV